MFAIKCLLASGHKPDNRNLMVDGNRILKLTAGLNVTLLDSHAIIPAPVSKLSSMFGFETQCKKGRFPHGFVRPDRLESVFPRLPNRRHYYCNRIKSPEERREFLDWYKANRDSEFDLKREAMEYCREDVLILAKACLRFRAQIMEIATIDPLLNCTTLASLCSQIFRLMFLPEETVAMVPTNTYEQLGKANSALGIAYLTWLARDRGVDIRSASPSTINQNLGPDDCASNRKPFLGEYVVPGVGSVDGYVEGSREIISILGCFWHFCQSPGNPQSFPKSTHAPTCFRLPDCQRLSEWQTPRHDPPDKLRGAREDSGKTGGS